MEKELIFYDIEIFKHNALVIFKDINKTVVRFFHNDFEGLYEFIQDKMLVGYNNYHYDDIILSKMCDQWSPTQLKELNDDIIGNTNSVKAAPFIESLDCFQEISTSKPSLKYIEGNMGKMILESTVPFDIDRELTTQEFEEVFYYCSYDIDTTIDVYKLRENSYFKVKASLVEKLGNKRASRWNTTTISAMLLAPQAMPMWANLRGIDEIVHLVPEGAKNMWYESVRAIGAKKKLSYTHHEFGNKIVFAFGGGHGAPTNVVRATNVILLDVTSLYPNIINNLRILGTYADRYEEILKKRIAIKHIDKDESEALKKILNSVSGNLDNQYSKLYNPNAAASMRIYGQIILYDLCKRLAPTCKILNINTDGVGFTTDSEEYLKIWASWEQDYNLKLEKDTFDLLIQKDVNNYIGVKNSNYKCKGGDVKRYNEDFYFDNNSCRIIDIAIVDHLVSGKSVLDSILENMNKPYLFQFILRAGGTFKGVFDKEGNQYQKINRVFASKEDNFAIYKKRADGGLVKFPDAPTKMKLWNDDCDKITDFSEWLDIDYYYNLINKKLEAWEV